MLRVFHLSNEQSLVAEKVDKYLLISGFQYEKFEHKSNWQPAKIYDYEFRVNVTKENKHKLERVSDFIPFKNKTQLSSFLGKLFDEKSFIVRRYNKYQHLIIFDNNQLKEILLGKFIKELTGESVREELIKAGITLKQ